MRRPDEKTLARRGVSSLDPLLGPLSLLMQRLRREGAIALYHRVAPEPSLLYQPLHPDEFAGHCTVLKRSFRVIPLSELLDRQRTGRSVAGCCSIAFDDGYLDFRDHALPILEAHSLPAAQFVITDCLESGRAPWNLRLNGLALRSSEIDAGYETMFAQLNHMAPAERDDWLAEREGTAAPADPRYQPPEMLRISDLCMIGSRGVEFGSHTVSHCSLGATDARTVQRELSESKRRLEELTGKEVSMVAYPNDSLTGSTMELARQVGYDAGLRSGNRGIGPRSNLFALPRFDVTDRPVEMLRMELGGTVESLRRLRSRISSSSA